MNLSKYSTFHIGGPAKKFHQPDTISNLQNLLQNLSKSEKIIWLGAGSNVLIRDKGINATVINTCNLNNLNILSNHTIRAEAGTSCAQLIKFCLHHSYADMAFLAGIPGTIGGALAMNAGAFNDAIWNHIVAIEVINKHGLIELKYPEDYAIDYRAVGGLKNYECFLAAHLKFTTGEVHITKEKIREIIRKRYQTQPIGKSCCGSVFKNPPGEYAGRLIETCGLKGFRINDAIVSEKHANFIINEGNAKSADVEKLIELIKYEVLKKHKIELELEVKIIGDL